ncbi:unnamed protein product, partial [Rotaria socialis]
KRLKKLKQKLKKNLISKKSRIVSQQRVQIIEYYDKKEKQIELQRKVQHSNLTNASRLSILKARDDYVQALKEEARKQLVILTKYTTIFANLIAQGLFYLWTRI